MFYPRIWLVALTTGGLIFIAKYRVQLNMTTFRVVTQCWIFFSVLFQCVCLCKRMLDFIAIVPSNWSLANIWRFCFRIWIIFKSVRNRCLNQCFAIDVTREQTSSWNFPYQDCRHVVQALMGWIIGSRYQSSTWIFKFASMNQAL